MKFSLDNFPGGFEPDQVAYNLPEGVFSDALNVCFREGAAEKCKGTESVFGSLSVTPMWALSVADGVTSYWMYANESVVYAYDGENHAQISSESYNATLDMGYTGGVFHGFVVVSDGLTDPQTWVPSMSNKLEPLSNWESDTYCKVIRPFSDFLVALKVTQDSTYNPRLLRWSDRAPQGALPGSWDYTDPTNQAGLNELAQTQDELVDCLPLRDVNIIYKQNCTWVMQYVGGDDIFGFREIFSQSGMLTENCAIRFGGNHLVLTDSDIIIHDGSNIQSIADKRVRRWLFRTLDATSFRRSFVIDNPREQETWICIPQSGDEFPTLALVYNRSTGKFHPRDLGAQMACAATGYLGGGQTLIDDDNTVIDLSTALMDQATYTPFAQRLVLFKGLELNAQQTEYGETLNGQPMTCYLERSNLGLTRDVGRVMRVSQILPRITGAVGEVIQLYVGVRDTIDSAVTYIGPYNYRIGIDHKVETRASGRFVSLRVAYTGSQTWKLSGFDVVFASDGPR